MFSFDLHKIFVSKNREVTIQCSAKINNELTIALYGNSGIGKSTVLRMIAGLETPSSGEIIFNGDVWYSKKDGINKSIKERNIGFVFQDYNLFPNMTVEQNLKYASPKGIITPLVNQLLISVGLTNLLASYPDQLSGGQQQRISIVRSLCQNPQLLLLDEPFSALDDDSILNLIDEIELIQKAVKTKIIVITHRKDVVLKMAELVIHMKDDFTTSQGDPSKLIVSNF